MPSIASPVFSCSLSGWAIEGTKTVNEGISSLTRRYAVTLAVSAIALPIFAVLDVAIYACACALPYLSTSPSHYLRLIRTILFIVQVPFLVIGNLFGGMVLPKVNHSAMFDTWFFYPLEEHYANEKLRILVNQFRRGEIDYKEFMKFRLKLPKSIFIDTNSSVPLLPLDHEGFAPKEHLLICLGTKIEHQSIVEELFEKSKIMKANKSAAPPKMATNVSLVLEESFYTLIEKGDSGKDMTSIPKAAMSRAFDAAVYLTQHINQPFNEKTKEFLKMFVRYEPALFQGILNYVDRTRDLEFANEAREAFRRQYRRQYLKDPSDDHPFLSDLDKARQRVTNGIMKDLASISWPNPLAAMVVSYMV